MSEKAGDKIGRWTLVSRGRTAAGRAAWNCVCDCGAGGLVITNKLRSGLSTSCGCYKAEVAAATSKSRNRGLSTPTCLAWRRMLKRCCDSNDHRYQDYGGRGIRVCDRWMDYSNFLADMGERPAGMSIDRIDNDGNYEPGNCRWATSREQSRNKRSNRLIEWNGRVQCATDWATELGIGASTLLARFRRGWSIERAMGASNG